MSVAPTVARARPRKTMSETGDPSPLAAAARVEDIERALVLAREVAAATAKGGAANMRMDHLQALFANGSGPVPAARIQAALEAAGLSVEPSLDQSPDSVALRVDRRRAALSPKNGGGRRKAAESSTSPAAPAEAAAAGEPRPRPSGVAAYQAAAGRLRRRAPRRDVPVPEETPAQAGAVSLGDAERIVAADHAGRNTAQSLAALMPAMIVPVLAASFLGPLFGAAFAGLSLLASALLSRPRALADGKLGPIRMPASLARSFLLVSFGVALGALLTSLALVAVGGGDTKSSDPNAPIAPAKKPPASTRPQTTTPPAPPAAEQREQQREAEAAARRRAERRRAERRREARARERRRERARQREATPPSGSAPGPGTATTP